MSEPTRDLHDAVVDRSLGTPVAPQVACVFCTRPRVEYAMPGGKAVCNECTRDLYLAYRRNKQLREAQQHGVIGVGSDVSRWLHAERRFG